MSFDGTPGALVSTQGALGQAAVMLRSLGSQKSVVFHQLASLVLEELRLIPG